MEVRSFDDNGWKATSGEGVAFAVARLFDALAFFPTCSTLNVASRVFHVGHLMYYVGCFKHEAALLRWDCLLH